MFMYKRPALRINSDPPKIHNPITISQNSFLYSIINPPPTKFHTHVKTAIYRKNDYLNLLKKDCKERGVTYVDPGIPDYEEYKTDQKNIEPNVDFIDHICLKLKILKSGIIRVKLDTSFLTLYEKYYSKLKQPPFKNIIQAYKSIGFSNEFIENIKSKHTKKNDYAKTIEKIIEKVFEKEPIKKNKKKVKEDICDEEQEEEQDEEEQEDDVLDNEGMDVELDEDLDEQQEEEEYFSDGGD